MTTLLDYKKKLANHDWWHMMSDDNRVYQRGAQSLSELRRIAKESEDHSKLFADYNAYRRGEIQEPKVPGEEA